MESAKVVFKKDEYGNELFVENNVIWLSCAGKPNDRLGSFDLEKKRIRINREYMDYNSRFNCYGFNEAVLMGSKKCDTVRLICPEGKFDIPISTILQYGSPLIYETAGLTNQLFIELPLIKKYPVSEKP